MLHLLSNNNRVRSKDTPLIIIIIVIITVIYNFANEANFGDEPKIKLRTLCMCPCVACFLFFNGGRNLVVDL